MKKTLALIVAMMLMLTLSVLAETRTTLIEADGELMEVEEILFTGSTGYTLWYAESLLEAHSDFVNDCFYPAGTDGESDIAFLVVAVEIDPDEAGALITEATGGYDDSYEISKIGEEMLEDGISVSTIQARGNGSIDRYYLVKDNNNVLCITATYPEEAAGNYGAYFETMAHSIRF